MKDKIYRRVISEYINELINIKPQRGLRNVESFRDKGFWAVKNCEPKLHVSFGNLKLPKSTCIVNLGSWLNCSGRKEGFCDICEVCYDKSPEVRFKDRCKDRLEQEIYWRQNDAKTIAYDIIKKIINYEHNNNIKVKLIRWAEVGELRNNDDLEKLIKCSNIIYAILNIRSYIYTHNKNLNFNTFRPFLTINGSNFMVDNEYRVIKEKDTNIQFNNLNDLANKRECICDCNNCSYCSNKDGFILIETLRL